MHRAPVFFEEYALHVARNPQPAQVLRPVNVPILEHPRTDFQILRQSQNIGFGQIHKSLLLAALDAAGLALETHAEGR